MPINITSSNRYLFDSAKYTKATSKKSNLQHNSNSVTYTRNKTILLNKAGEKIKNKSLTSFTATQNHSSASSATLMPKILPVEVNTATDVLHKNHLKEFIKHNHTRTFIEAAPLTTVEECHYFFESKCDKYAPTKSDDHKVIITKEQISNTGAYVKGNALFLDDTKTYRFGVSEHIVVNDDTGIFEIGYDQSNLHVSSKWFFIPSSSERLKANNLKDNETIIKYYPVTATDGTKRNVSIIIKGANHKPIIQANNPMLNITEDDYKRIYFGKGMFANLASGKLNITDVDSTESKFKFMEIHGRLGEFKIDTDGSWTYYADTGKSYIQALKQNQTRNEIFTINSIDGTPYNVSATIQGQNDKPIIAGNGEDYAIQHKNSLFYTLAGILFIDDPDTGEESFIEGTYKGKYGNLYLETDGHYVYTAPRNQTSIETAINQSKNLIDVIPIRTKDATLSSIAVEIRHPKEYTTSMPVTYNNHMHSTLKLLPTQESRLYSLFSEQTIKTIAACGLGLGFIYLAYKIYSCQKKSMGNTFGEQVKNAFGAQHPIVDDLYNTNPYVVVLKDNGTQSKPIEQISCKVTTL